MGPGRKSMDGDGEVMRAMRGIGREEYERWLRGVLLLCKKDGGK